MPQLKNRWGHYPGITAIADEICRTQTTKTIQKIGKIIKKTEYIYVVYDGVVPIYEGPIAAVVSKSGWTRNRINNASKNNRRVDCRYYIKRRNLKDGETWPKDPKAS